MEASFPTEYLGNNTKIKIPEHRFTKPKVRNSVNSSRRVKFKPTLYPVAD